MLYLQQLCVRPATKALKENDVYNVVTYDHIKETKFGKTLNPKRNVKITLKILSQFFRRI